MPGLRSTGAPPPMVLEGEFTTWAKKWEWDFPEGLESAFVVSITLSPNYVYILYMDDEPFPKNRFVILHLIDGSAVFTSPSGEDYQSSPPTITYEILCTYNTLAPLSSGAAVFSVFGKYVCLNRDGNDRFEVWKDGAKAWTSPLASEAVPGATDYYHAALRYDGKYIIAMTDTDKIVCFEGS